MRLPKPSRSIESMWALILLVASLLAPPAVRAQDAIVADTSPVTTTAPLEKILAGDVAPQSIDDLRAMQSHISLLADRIKNATVGIECQGAQGSGVIISRDGIVLTAAHVIGQPGIDAWITLSTGRRVKAKTKGLNHAYDSGMMQIVDEGDWDYLDLGESGSLHLGQWVMAVGHPGGYQEQRGTVVRVGRILNMTSRVLRTDCTLVGGDSGGPLVDMDGYVIGIHSRIGMRLSENLHVPVDAFATEWDALESDAEIGGSQPRAWLGFQLVDGELTIESVAPDGPSDKAGMRPGDKIAKINGREITSREELWVEFFQLQIGEEVVIVVLRDDQEVELTLTVEGRQER